MIIIGGSSAERTKVHWGGEVQNEFRAPFRNKRSGIPVHFFHAFQKIWMRKHVNVSITIINRNPFSI